MATRTPMTLRAKQSRPALRPTWSGRSHVSTFIRCLHLLDLDLLEDWPDIDGSTFTSTVAKQNQQNKLRATEWSLYRLFELHNAELARDKLRPFFPPSSPLQSVNLRAALYRCLGELKKNGVLGAQYQLRKTMLDECKGEKFEELLAGFALIVLHKESEQHHARLQENNQKLDDAQLLPVILAHRKSLSSKLEQRKLAQKHVQDVLERVKEARQDLTQRWKMMSNSTTQPDLVLRQQLENLVHTDWIGDHTWTTLLLKGVPPKPAFQEIAQTSGQSTDVPPTPVETLVNNLNASLNEHRQRLAEWKVLAKDLQAKQPTQSQPESTSLTNTAISSRGRFKFSRHKQPNTGIARSSKSSNLIPDQDFQVLLHHMQDELRFVRPDSNEQDLQSPGAAALCSPQRRDVLQSPAYKMKNFEADTTTSHHSRKVNFHGDCSPDSSPISTLPDEESTVPWLKDLKDSIITPDVSTPTKVSESIPSAHPPTNNSYDSPTSPSIEWMSLMDRTRASMSGFDAYKQQAPNSRPKDDLAPRETLDTETLPQDNQGRRITLVERTRQSMSLFSAAAATKKSNTINRRKSQRMSQIFPVNQFETPGRPRPRISEFGPGSESSTPREKLFEEAADYESVFKSRPRIAMSPSLSPDRSQVGFDSILEHDLDGLQLASDDEYD